MIVYNGVALENIANVKIEDIRVSPIKENPVTRPRAIVGGSTFVRMRDGERTITITFAVLEKDFNTRHQQLMNISAWAKTDAENRLELPIEPNKYLQCVCTAKPEPSTRVWWESKLRLVFTCYENPYWTARAEKTVNCGTAFTVLGDAPPLMEIGRTLSASASNQSYSDGTNTMTFSTIPAGGLVIDLNRQTARVGANSIMQYYAPTGHFIIPHTGTQTITGTGTVKYVERWR
jgi:phage-related protein